MVKTQVMKIEDRPKRLVYLPTALDSVRMIAKRGLTDSEICIYFGIPEKLFQKWVKAYPSFRDALEEGRTEADVKVLQALHKNATGHVMKNKKTTVTIKNGKKSVRTVITETPVAGQTEAQKYWLNNRQPKNWKNRISSESDVRAALIIDDRRKLIDGLFTELMQDPKLIADIAPAPKDKE